MYLCLVLSVENWPARRAAATADLADSATGSPTPAPAVAIVVHDGEADAPGIRGRPGRKMKLAEDSVVIVDLGDTTSARFTFVGKRRPLPSNDTKIV